MASGSVKCALYGEVGGHGVGRGKEIRNAKEATRNSFVMRNDIMITWVNGRGGGAREVERDRERDGEGNERASEPCAACVVAR